MATIKINQKKQCSKEYGNATSITKVKSTTYHVHNDNSNNCLDELCKILDKHKK